jgi:hypothetical protein
MRAISFSILLFCLCFQITAQDSTYTETRGRFWLSVGGGESTYQEKVKPHDIVGFPVNEMHLNYWRQKTLYSLGLRGGKGYGEFHFLLGKKLYSKKWIQVYGSGGLGFAIVEGDSRIALPLEVQVQFTSLKYISYGFNLNASFNTFNGAVFGASFLFLNIGLLR